METNNRVNIKKLFINMSYSKESTQLFELFFMVKRHWIEIFLQGIDEKFGSMDFFLKEIYLSHKENHPLS